MKDDMKIKTPNGTPKIIIPSDGVVNLDGVLKFGGCQRVTMLRISKNR